MAVQKLTPPLGAFGIYKLKAPWVTTANVNYRCVSLRRVEEVVKSGKNIHDTFYAPVGLVLLYQKRILLWVWSLLVC